MFHVPDADNTPGSTLTPHDIDVNFRALEPSRTSAGHAAFEYGQSRCRNERRPTTRCPGRSNEETGWAQSGPRGRKPLHPLSTNPGHTAGHSGTFVSLPRCVGVQTELRLDKYYIDSTNTKKKFHECFHNRAFVRPRRGSGPFLAFRNCGRGGAVCPSQPRSGFEGTEISSRRRKDRIEKITALARGSSAGSTCACHEIATT
jgi:hypothetical protein